MAISANEGSASIGTSEYSLPAATTSGVPTSQTDDSILQCFIDFSGITAGADSYEVKVYEKVTSGGTQREVYQALLVTKPEVVVLPSLMLLNGWDITVKKISGTDRTIYWSLRKVT